MSLLGQRLRQEREARGLALVQVELDTRIRASIIQSLEEGNMDTLPPEPFLRGLLRTYANYLRVDAQEILDLYTADTQPIPPPPPPSPAAPPHRPVAEPHPPTKRPEVEANYQYPYMPPPPPAEMMQKQAPAAPVEEAERAEEKAQEVAPRSIVEPFKALRRRLPLAPPSAKPTNPVLKPANPAPPPSAPPEILPPPQFIPVVHAEQHQVEALPPLDDVTIFEEIPELVVADDGEEQPAEPKKSNDNKQSLVQRLIHSVQALGHFPRSALIGAGLGMLLIVALIGVFAYSRLYPEDDTIAAIQQAETLTPYDATDIPAVPDGSTPTSIPTIEATAPPFTAVSVVASLAPSKATPIAKTPSTRGALSLTIAASQPVTAQIGIDGLLVFNGPIAPGTMHSWSAVNTLYLRVENFIGATVTFNDRKQVPLIFEERTLFERQWNMGANGRPVAATPIAPRAETPTPFLPLLLPTATPPPPAASTPTPTAPTPTLTPFS